jgi:phosphoribosylformylglycinamidine synthase II
MDGVVAGVKVGGNCSGIPTPQGFIYFDPRYKGKPLVFVGTVGLIPRASAGRKAHQKKARPGDLIVMAGGRVGQDGIHGATFSSEALDSGSPATAVQIGDPITQKKMSDAILSEARDRQLYSSITDNGAGGLSCSAAEMAKECGGCRVELEKVPLKYPGLEPWKIWVSESQERMTLAVPQDKWEEFSLLMRERKVEATVIGEFTDSGKCVVTYRGETVMDVDMGFLHDGLPPRPMQTTYMRPRHEEPAFPEPVDLGGSLLAMLGRLNIAGYEFISMQYDHEVRAGSVIKPLQGRGRINGDASVTKVLLGSNRAVVLSQGINPSYSDLDTYHMAACAIDAAVRNAVAAGANLAHLALLDNFCWCSADEPERLGQLKEAVRACHDYSIAYGTPFISGKDSMFNDFKGFDSEGKSVKISVPPTLMVSSIGVMEDCRKAVSMDFKLAGDLIYVLGETRDELGGSEYFAQVGERERGERFIGNSVPKVDAEKNKKLYRALGNCISRELVASAVSIQQGGLAVALAKSALAGGLGLDASLVDLPGRTTRDDFALYSESPGRVVVTVAPDDREEFEAALAGNACAQVGTVREDDKFSIRGRAGTEIIAVRLGDMLEAYRAPLRGF